MVMPETEPSNPRLAPPLAGIRVLDFSRVLAGPLATLALADFGADVIKVEQPTVGDDTRHWGRREELGGESAYFLFANRNKRSVAIDISSPEGQAAVRRMAGSVDVVIENYRPDVMRRHGLDFASLSKENPGLVYCSISGYGHDSPLWWVGGYDPIAQAESGWMSINGAPDEPPVRTGVPLADIVTGLHAVSAILAALRVRDRDGVGQHIDLALLDCTVAMTSYFGQVALITGQDPARFGNGHAFLEPVGVFEASDGSIFLMAGNPQQWQRLCVDVLERPDLADDPRFANNTSRFANRETLHDLLTVAFSERNRASWIEKLRTAKVPAGAVRGLAESLASEEIRYRGLIKKIRHSSGQDVNVIASPIRFSATSVVEPISAPLLGEQTAEVLTEFGLSPSDIAKLDHVEAKAIK
jgi:crotonobetainyl-CoA:carnitine CoA-transferase CaiB-like acyl-CoA transferase